MKIAFYISNHGFGHIMRNLPVIAYLLKETGHSVILVTAKKQISLAQQYLRKESGLDKAELNSRFKSVEQDTDLGLIVKPGTLQIDKVATTNAVKEYTAKFPQKIEDAVEFFKTENIERLVCDIVPWALTAAKEAGIPSFLMASFTWIEQYEEFMADNVIEPYRDCYADADRVLFYELVNAPTRKRFPQGIDVGLCNRPFHQDKICEIRERYKEKKIIFVSVGGSNSGIHGDVDVSQLPYQFIATSGVPLKGNNVVFLPVEIENTQDYIAASDYCISKAGWGTISEIMCAGKPMALLGRPDVPEDCMYIAELVKRKEAVEIQVEELLDVEKIVSKLDALEKYSAYENSFEEIARHIIFS